MQTDFWVEKLIYGKIELYKDLYLWFFSFVQRVLFLCAIIYK